MNGATSYRVQWKQKKCWVIIICISFLKAKANIINYGNSRCKPVSLEIGSFGCSFESKEFLYKTIGIVYDVLISLGEYSSKARKMKLVKNQKRE